ncbi:MAG TPA: ribonuclease E inhibitor RraB [Chitinophagales bacterium]|nr:ribonuclease E inhibitor RraB [Chitinophagales bacterium]
MKILLVILLFVVVIFFGFVLYLIWVNKTKKYIIEAAMLQNILKDKGLNPHILQKLNLPFELWRLDYSFHTNKHEKAILLSDELKNMGYLASIRKDNLLYVIEEWEVFGWTGNVRIKVESINEWTETMHRIGHKYDCRFDRWGTFSTEELIDKAIESKLGAGGFIAEVLKQEKKEHSE